MFFKAFIACACLGSLYGMEGDSEIVADSHLSFIFKEKQNENKIARPQWDFLSELTDEEREAFFLFETPLGSTGSTGSTGATGATGSAVITGNTKLSMSSPSMAASLSMQNASTIISFLRSHQNVLNPVIRGNDVGDFGNALGGEKFDTHQHIAQANVDGVNPKRTFWGKGLKQSEPSQPPSGTTRILAHGNEKNDIWVNLFAEKLKLEPDTDFNTVYDTSFGFFLGYDRFLRSAMMTGAVGYNYSKITESGNVGHGHQNQIFGAYQGTFYLPECIYLECSLYGSVNLNDYHRFTSSGAQSEIAESSFTSYTLDPHIQLGYDWIVNDWFIIEPFLSNDFFFNFQPSFSETGSPGFNEHQDALNSGLYLVEPGVNLYQRISKSWGLLVLRQEIGYERAQPMFGKENTFAIINVQNGISSPTGLRDLNLFIFGFQLFARVNRGFYGDIFYRGEFGSEMTSNTLNLKAGYFF